MTYIKFLNYLNATFCLIVLNACVSTGLMGSQDDFTCKDYDRKVIKCNSLSDNYETSLLNNLPSYKITYKSDSHTNPDSLIVRPPTVEEAKSAESRLITTNKNDSINNLSNVIMQTNVANGANQASLSQNYAKSNSSQNFFSNIDKQRKEDTYGQMAIKNNNTSPQIQNARIAPTIARVWLAPWEDSDNDLNDESFIYITLDTGKWNIDAYKSKINDQKLAKFNLDINQRSQEKPKDTKTSAVSND